MTASAPQSGFLLFGVGYQVTRFELGRAGGSRLSVTGESPLATRGGRGAGERAQVTLDHPLRVGHLVDQAGVGERGRPAAVRAGSIVSPGAAPFAATATGPSGACCHFLCSWGTAASSILV